jgi:hypothetical protein
MTDYVSGSPQSLQRALDEMIAQHNDLGKALRMALDGQALSGDIRRRFALAAEVEDLIRREDDTRRMCEAMEDVLNETANALKGEPPRFIHWAWHDLPKVARELKAAHESGK